MCDRVVVMYAGQVVEEADVFELFASPKHPYTKGLIASVPKIGDNKEVLESINGQVPSHKICRMVVNLLHDVIKRCLYAIRRVHRQ